MSSCSGLPVRALSSQAQLDEFLKSDTFQGFVQFIDSLGNSVRGISISQLPPVASLSMVPLCRDAVSITASRMFDGQHACWTTCAAILTTIHPSPRLHDLGTRRFGSGLIFSDAQSRWSIILTESSWRIRSARICSMPSGIIKELIMGRAMRPILLLGCFVFVTRLQAPSFTPRIIPPWC